MPPAAAVSPLPQAAARERIAQCWALVEEGRCLEARALLSGLAQDAPGLSAAHELMAVSLQALGDLDGAEREMRAAVRLDRSDPALLTRLGEILVCQEAWGEAERSFHGALALNRRFAPAAVALTRLLLAQGRPAEALQATVPLTLRHDAPAAVLEAQASALRALGKDEDARAVSERARRSPRPPLP